MKKYFALAIALIMMFTTLAYAEVDLTGMSLDELVLLNQQVNDAIFANNGAVVLQSGDYVAGKDIAVGSYVIRFFQNDDNHTYGRITVYTSLDAMKTYESDYNDYRLALAIIDSNSQNGIEISMDDKPEKFETGNYIVSDYDERFAIGSTCRVILEEGQVLHVAVKSDEMFTTIEQAKGLFMD